MISHDEQLTMLPVTPLILQYFCLWLKIHDRPRARLNARCAQTIEQGLALQGDFQPGCGLWQYTSPCTNVQDDDFH
jgi:hypothetical protein